MYHVASRLAQAPFWENGHFCRVPATSFLEFYIDVDLTYLAVIEKIALIWLCGLREVFLERPYAMLMSFKAT